LAAIADNGDLLVEDAGEIGVAIVIDAHGLMSPRARNESARTKPRARGAAFDRFFRAPSSMRPENDETPGDWLRGLRFAYRRCG
jgi:hypothetical protein